MKLISALSALAILFATYAPTASATPVEVSFTTSGSAGNWTYDFTFTNNTGNQYLYFLGVSVAGGSVSNNPGSFYNYPAWSIGSASYNDIWLNQYDYTQTINPGASMSGFEVVSNALTVQSTVEAFAYGYNYGILYQGNDYQSGSAYNPGFATIATSAAVPEPALITLIAVGLLGFAASRRKADQA